MKLISKEIRVNEMTYAPEYVVTISIPIEPMQDLATSKGEDALKKELGEKLVELLK